MMRVQAPLLVLKLTGKPLHLPRRRVTMGYERIDVVAFNIDGSGTALIRVYPKGSFPELQTVRGNDLTLLLEGDADGCREYIDHPDSWPDRQGDQT